MPPTLLPGRGCGSDSLLPTPAPQVVVNALLGAIPSTTYPDAETPRALFSGLCFCFLKQVFHSPWVMLPLVFRVSELSRI